MPVYNKADVKKGGFQQVREALVKFEADVVATEDGQWGGTLLGDDGKPLPPKEFLEIKCMNVKVLETSEPLTMDLNGQDFSFRINCSDYDGSFWVDEFLASADKLKILLPDGIVGKRVIWKKAKHVWTIKGKETSYSNFVIDGVVGPSMIGTAPVGTPAPNPTVSSSVQVGTQIPLPITTPTEQVDPMAVAADIAVGKTETQFRSAIALHPAFANSPLLALAKAGAITQTLINEKKLILVANGTKQVYQ